MFRRRSCARLRSRGINGAGTYAKAMTSRLPHAAAYLRSVAKEGECFSLENELSSCGGMDAGHAYLVDGAIEGP